MRAFARVRAADDREYLDFAIDRVTPEIVTVWNQR